MIFNNGKMQRWRTLSYVRRALKKYIKVENITKLYRYFLEESINKAIKLANGNSGATTSGFVDDVFFIARKVIR